jgi:transcriptional regulator with XRE-family HTH domain
MVQDRISELVKALSLTANSFAGKIGVTQAVIHGIVSGRRNAPRWETYEKILEAVPYVSAEWLSRGSPPMFLDEEKQKAYEEARQQAITNTTTFGTITQTGNQRKGTITQTGINQGSQADAEEVARLRKALDKCQEDKSKLSDKVIELLERK